MTVDREAALADTIQSLAEEMDAAGEARDIAAAVTLVFERRDGGWTAPGARVASAGRRSALRAVCFPSGRGG